ncbi:uncharacterized exonuclease domain-containing protein At3g15140 [Asparagus officinalis]|uniref:uncharacterized exonuclease domain-containing protein At3g15140 n=1 Tax=Asparagus officinalis TaxID=4686 RepID=UPI00098E2537|nr:uncharacterized exonuclease domain-containing protein At3g15140 [Asparagus officinalis]XP_020269006.1 uncharacterized exonuclease domain-containing protein At3g15140 [Asparagus officinalis]
MMSFVRLFPSPRFISPLSSPPLLRRRLSSPRSNLSVSSAVTPAASPGAEEMVSTSQRTLKSWKPMCLYYTQGKCTLMDDEVHLEKFNHSYLSDLQANDSDVSNLKSQDLDYILVLDLEGKVEILEFPIVMIDCRTMEFVDSFHRFVRPTEMGQQRINEYIKGKYGKFGIDRVWHDTAIPFKDVIMEFETWVSNHHLWKKESEGPLHGAAFVTCGNWDIKTKIPQQCKVSKMKIPPYFMEWINLKDVYLNFYNRRATGMMTMMRELEIPVFGSHHLGIDDTKNIARVVQRLLSDGALLKITARRISSDPGDVKFLFKNRIR